MVAEPKGSLPRWRILVDGAASIAVVLVCLAAARNLLSNPAQQSPGPAARPAARPKPPALPSEPISMEGAKVRGGAQATVAVIEYSDFECPYCSVFARDVLPQLDRTYLATGKILMAFRNLPLDSLHRFAQGAAIAGECAEEQGRFWPMHDVMFKNPAQLDPTSLKRYAVDLGLDTKAFETCVAGSAGGKVLADTRSATALSISGTPTFLIGTVQSDRRVKVTARLSGVAPFQRFQQEIEKLLVSRVPTE